MNGPFDQFCDELDSLIEHWREKPVDDQLSVAQVVGALQFAIFNLMSRAQLESSDD